MKYETIKKRLITESGFSAVLLAVLGGCLYGIILVRDNALQQKTDLQTQVAAVKNERQTLEGKYAKIQSNMDLYRELMEKSENDGLNVDRQVLRNKIEDFKSRYFLNDLSITMGAVKDLKGPQYQYKTNQMVSSELSIDFDTLTDEDIFSFLGALQEELPGGLKIVNFNINRANKVTDEALRTIAKSGQYSMAKGQAKFVWMGIKSLEPEEPPPGGKATP